MHHTIPVYRAEVEAGIADRVRANASIAYCVPLTPLNLDEAARERAYANLRESSSAAGIPEESFELFPVRDILTSTGWNNNDDIFDKVETYSARHTASHKPFNFGHDQRDIIGHILASQVVDENMVALADDLAVEDVPDLFHIVSDSVIYRHIGGKERAAFIEQTIAEIQDGRWSVSMECFFRGFDYGLMDPDGRTFVVARNEQTAHLTRHLRAYAHAEAPRSLHTGRYRDQASGIEYRIGRVMRNLAFCGKGLVERPANPASIIIQKSTAAFISTPLSLGYVVAHTPEETPMPETTPDARLTEALATIETLNRTVAELRNKDVEAKVASLEAAVAEKATEVAALNARLAAITEANATLTSRAETAETALATARETIAASERERTLKARVATVVAKGLDAAKAEAVVTNLAVLDDAAFAATVETLAASWKPAPPAPAKRDDISAIDNAKPEPEPAMAATTEDAPAAAFAAVSDFFANNILHTTRTRKES